MAMHSLYHSPPRGVAVRDMVRRSQQTPTKEWPLVFVEECNALLVVRQWPGGEITAYTASAARDEAL